MKPDVGFKDAGLSPRGRDDRPVAEVAAYVALRQPIQNPLAAFERRQLVGREPRNHEPITDVDAELIPGTATTSVRRESAEQPLGVRIGGLADVSVAHPHV